MIYFAVGGEPLTDGRADVASLQLTSTPVQGCQVIWSDQFRDFRGYFAETFNRKDFLNAKLPVEWPQDNISNSEAFVLRGLHIQRNNPQGKLVRCVKGTIYDVCLDLRPDSPTFLKYHMQMLHGGGSMYCPPGTAHGFLAMVPRTIVYYKCTSIYDVESDGGVNPLDPELKIPWPCTSPVLSEKDRHLPTLREWLEDQRGLSNVRP